eukprot:Skav220838  [mRNA]  locus=scaffold1888:198152:203280:- [translate_table: standard]
MAGAVIVAVAAWYTALSWAVFCISGHPDVEKRMVEELAGLDDETLTYQQVSKLPYLQAVVNEALRLYPSVPFDSKAMGIRGHPRGIPGASRGP